MLLLNKNQPFLFFSLSEYPFLIDVRCFLPFLPFSDDLQSSSFNQDLPRFIPFTCVTCLDKLK